MRTRIIQIGNSQGIRIPKPVLEQTGLEGEVELEVQDRQITIKPIGHPRQGWSEAFRQMAEQQDDVLLDPDETGQTAWDQDEWQWS